MTISSEVRTAGPYTGTGSVTSYPFNFKVFQASDLLVSQTDLSLVQTTLALSADYSVTLNPNQNVGPGGTVNLMAALPAGFTLELTSNVSVTQGASLTQGGGFSPVVIENALDRLTILLQQLGIFSNQNIRVPEIAGVGVLPDAASRANSLFSWDANGNPIATVPASGSAADVMTRLANAADSTLGDALVAVNNGMTGEIARTLHYWIKASNKNLCNWLTTAQVDDILSNTGSIDVSGPFAAATLAMGGGFLELPPGKILADNMSIAASRTIVHGQGNATRIIAPTAANNVFSVTGDFCEIRHVAIDAAVTRTGGRYVDVLPGANRFRLSNFWFERYLEAIRCDGISTAVFEHGMLFDGVPNTGIGIRIYSTINSGGFDLKIHDVKSDGASDIFSAVYVLCCGDLTLTDNDLIHGGQVLYVNPQAGQVAVSIDAIGNYFDSSQRGVYLFAQGAGAAIGRVLLEGNSCDSHAINGMKLATSGGGSLQGVKIGFNTMDANASNGFEALDTGCSDFHLLQNTLSNNGTSGSHASGGAIGAGVSNWTFKSNRSGLTDLFGTPVQDFGLSIAVGSGGNYEVSDNDLRNNLVEAVVDGGTGTGKVLHDNPDYDTTRSTVNPGTINAGLIYTTTVALAGAFVGDKCTFEALGVTLAGVFVYGDCSTGGTVNVHYHNPTAGNITIGSHTLITHIERRT